MRDSYAELGTVRLHYVEAGEGPLVVLLHGFPEFWYAWRHQIEPLAEAGFRVVAPDLRGYNLSSKPPSVGDYDIALLAEDVRDLVHERGEQRACVAGHDWGGAVAWATAGLHPEAVERLAILNAPHPRVFLAHLKDPRQLARSWYMGFFQLPYLPEELLRRGYRRTFTGDARPGAFTEADLERYGEALNQPGAPTAMVNYYRALGRMTPRGAGQAAPARRGSDAGDLGNARPLPRGRPGRARPPRRPQPRARDPARHLALGPARRAWTSDRPSRRVLRRYHGGRQIAKAPEG